MHTLPLLYSKHNFFIPVASRADPGDPVKHSKLTHVKWR